MRRLVISALVILMGTAFAPAAETPAAAPEASATPTMTADESRVLVAPFTEANEQMQPDWINRAIHQAVVDELSSLSSVQVLPNDAREAGAKYIVRGTIQRLAEEIRVTGRVQSAADGKTIGGFKATGPQHQLFAIEDSIAEQLKRILAPMEATPAGLEDARAVATAGDSRTLPQQPLRGVYEGSDLQRALDDRDFLNRAARRAPTSYDPPPVYVPPTYPVGGTMYPPYGYGYGYGSGWGWPGWGWGWGGGNVIIVKPGHGHHGGGGGGGGSVQPPIAHAQTQRLRNAAVYPGQSGNFIGPLPPRPSAPAPTPAPAAPKGPSH